MAIYGKSKVEIPGKEDTCMEINEEIKTALTEKKLAFMEINVEVLKKAYFCCK